MFKFKTFTSPSNDDTHIEGINGLGQIVGFYVLNGEEHSFIETAGKFLDLPYPSGAFEIRPFGINASGVVTGNYETNDTVEHGFVYTLSNGYTILDDPAAGTSGFTNAFGINDAGQVVGCFGDGTSTSAFIYNSNTGKYTTLVDPNATLETIAYGINKTGQIVGEFYDGLSYHGFLYFNGNFTSIDDPLASAAAGGTQATAINSAGQIVGVYFDALGGLHGFLYDHGTYQTMDDPLASEAAGGTVITGISDQGTLVGYYSDDSGVHGFTTSSSPFDLTIASADRSEAASTAIVIDSSSNVSFSAQAGSIAFTDTDPAANPTASIIDQTETALDLAGKPVALTASEIQALEAHFNLQNTSYAAGSGTTQWNFAASTPDLSFLAQLSSVVLTNTVQISDQDGDADTAIVTVTLQGTTPAQAAEQTFANVNQEKSDAQQSAHDYETQLAALNVQLSSAKTMLNSLTAQQVLDTSTTVAKGLVVLGDVASIALEILEPEIIPFLILKNIKNFGEVVATAQDIAVSWNALTNDPSLKNFNAFMFNVDKLLDKAAEYNGVVHVGLQISNLVKDAKDFQEALEATGLDTDITALSARISSLQAQITSVESQETNAENLDPLSGPIATAIVKTDHVVQLQGIQGNIDGLLGDGMSLLLTNKTGQISSATQTVIQTTSLVEAISLLDKSETVSVDPFAGSTIPITAIIEGVTGAHDSVVLSGNYGAYQVALTSAGVTVHNASIDLLIQNVDTVVFADNVVTFDNFGHPTVSSKSGAPKIGTTFNAAPGNISISNFDQAPFYDPLHGDKIHCQTNAAPADSANFIRVQDIVSSYADAASLANELLQRYEFVVVGYDQGISDAGATGNQPAPGQDFLLLFADLNGQHKATSIVRLIGLDDVDQLQPSDILTDGHSPSPMSVVGTASNDIIAAGGSNKTIAGAGGHDLIKFHGSSDEYHITASSGLITVTDLVLGRDAVVNIAGGEDLNFSDKNIFVESSDNANIARLYSAALGRSPDTSGLFGWEDIYSQNISPTAKAAGVYTSLAQTGDGFGSTIAGGFAQSTEFQAKYGNLNDAGLVTQLYLNVLSRTPAQAELNAWLDLMHNDGYSRDMVLVGFAESPENIAKTSADWLIQI